MIILFGKAKYLPYLCRRVDISLLTCMKTRLNLLLIAVLVFCSACTRTKNGQGLRDTVDEIAMYLTNNYHIGDNMVFVQDDITEQVWTVEENRLDTLREVDEGENEEDPLAFTEKYNFHFVIQSATETFKITWMPSQNRYGICSLRFQNESGENVEYVESPLPKDIFGATNEKLVLQGRKNTNVFCTLKRNVGIVEFSDGVHTWRLKE